MGDPLDIVACCEVPFKLGEGNVCATSFVCTERARWPVAGLIGQNILSEEKVDLLLSRGAISIEGMEIIIQTGQGETRRLIDARTWYSCDGAPIRLAEESVLPALSECVLMGEVTSELARGQLSVAEVISLRCRGSPALTV